MIECSKCGSPMGEGKVFTRTNPLGEIGMWACDPSCVVPFINQESALIYALDKHVEVDTPTDK